MTSQKRDPPPRLRQTLAISARGPSSEIQGQSVGLGEKAGRKFSSKGERAPGYRLSPNYFQKFKRTLASDWGQCGEQFLFSSFREFAHDGYRLATLTQFVYQACGSKENFYFLTFLTRNEGTIHESKKRLGCYKQEQFNFPYFDSSRCILYQKRKLKMRR